MGVGSFQKRLDLDTSNKEMFISMLISFAHKRDRFSKCALFSLHTDRRTTKNHNHAPSTFSTKEQFGCEKVLKK